MTLSPIPQTPTARRETIRSLLAQEQIGSQKDLRERLSELGVEVTQATLSRDLVDMRATKIRTADGARVYSVPDIDGGSTHEAEAGYLRLQKWCQTLLVSSVLVENQLVLRTTVGAANLLGSAIDAVRFDEVAGTIAGDDTILVICRSAEDAQTTQRFLMELAEPSTAPDID
ncbi:arginine repressor [Schaalia hyovaginalis]|uniref:Arginine repressor n=1 Tax=Schaalia hyovaginalis TaxID=29316 RepID=A0A923IXM2_9ACTO|nr:arginine repressor [Schaalia hyovaginalis]MBB6334568.1 transcriptional regulator of arginine metabolism [Schaalia hyovaginalis]MCI7670982.1 arginine repressor [Schaalia hyovaginalis]MDY2669682.1 arginine repressor [Schaalia hyovaginalis]MDY5505863.1 arginine repressor [Schaalia hyovaginalis]